jgi:cytochrome d ubiquinol oxidase subunit II
VLPGLTIRQAAAGHDTLVAVTVAVIVGGAILFPSLTLLFRLMLGGQLDAVAEDAGATAPSPAAVLGASTVEAAGRVTVAMFVAAIGFLTLADATWAHTIGVICLFGFGVAGFVALAPWQAAGEEHAHESS